MNVQDIYQNQIGGMAKCSTLIWVQYLPLANFLLLIPRKYFPKFFSIVYGNLGHQYFGEVKCLLMTATDCSRAKQVIDGWRDLHCEKELLPRVLNILHVNETTYSGPLDLNSCFENASRSFLSAKGKSFWVLARIIQT